MIFTVVAALVLAWAYSTKKPWSELGFVKPESWIATVLESAILGAVFKVGMKALVMPLLKAPETNQTYHYLVGNPSGLVGAILLMLVGAGFSEEVFFRAFLFDRLRKLFGDRPWTTTAIVVITSALFASAHYNDLGVPGVEQAAITGLVFALFYSQTGRIIPVMIAHASFDLTAVAIIYYDLEPRVAHLIFR